MGEHPLSRLIEDLNETSAAKMNYKEISDAVKITKGNDKEDKGVKDLFEDANERAEQRGLEKGFKQSKIETAKKLLQLGKLSLDDIAESTDLPLETVKQIAG